jgi:hypothetical protein
MPRSIMYATRVVITRVLPVPGAGKDEQGTFRCRRGGALRRVKIGKFEASHRERATCRKRVDLASRFAGRAKIRGR